MTCSHSLLTCAHLSRQIHIPSMTLLQTFLLYHVIVTCLASALPPLATIWGLFNALVLQVRLQNPIIPYSFVFFYLYSLHHFYSVTGNRRFAILITFPFQDCLVSTFLKEQSKDYRPCICTSSACTFQAGQNRFHPCCQTS